ncbi:MAG: transporter substrate-binding domain-containing protein [Burkholderiales bacterium]|nr:transporter substrate-binding domain-containing protein [Burkholderiales bacterium]
MKLLYRILLICVLSPFTYGAHTVSFVSTDYPPYFSPALPEGGAVAAIAKAAFAASGYDMKLTFRPWARLMAETEAGEYDGVVAVWYKADREPYLAFSSPVIDTVIGFYGRVDKPIAVDRLDRLHAYTIGTVRGYANPDVFEAAHFQTDESVDDLTNLRKLLARRIDLVLIDKALAAELVRKSLVNQRAQIEWRNPPVMTMPLYVGIAKKRPDYLETLAAFNRGLALIRKNGEYARIIERFKFEQ